MLNKNNPDVKNKKISSPKLKPTQHDLCLKQEQKTVPKLKPIEEKKCKGQKDMAKFKVINYCKKYINKWKG